MLVDRAIVVRTASGELFGRVPGLTGSFAVRATPEPRPRAPAVFSGARALWVGPSCAHGNRHQAAISASCSESRAELKCS
jgi:hypothetical protein